MATLNGTLTLPAFGEIKHCRLVAVDELFAVVSDKFPISPGHTLIIARRSVARFQHLTSTGQAHGGLLAALAGRCRQSVCSAAAGHHHRTPRLISGESTSHISVQATSALACQTRRKCRQTASIPNSSRAFRIAGRRIRSSEPAGSANPAGDRTPSSVGYAHDADPAVETASGVAAPALAARRRGDSCWRVLDAVPARHHTSRAPKPRNPVESAPCSYPAATPHSRRRRLVGNHQRGNGGEPSMMI
jgi:HIT domain